MKDELVTPISKAYLRRNDFDEVFDNEFQKKELVVRYTGEIISVFVGRDIMYRTYFRVKFEHELEQLLKFLEI